MILYLDVKGFLILARTKHGDKVTLKKKKRSQFKTFWPLRYVIHPPQPQNLKMQSTV